LWIELPTVLTLLLALEETLIELLEAVLPPPPCDAPAPPE